MVGKMRNGWEILMKKHNEGDRIQCQYNKKNSKIKGSEWEREREAGRRNVWDKKYRYKESSNETIQSCEILKIYCNSA